MEHPCLVCGACCAYFRVSFYWSEADPTLNGTVPAEMVEELNSVMVCMAGTNQKDKRCVALEGTIGSQVFCKIYPNRSSSCRGFGVDWEDGKLLYNPIDLERCNRARVSKGLVPLTDIIPPELMVLTSD